MAAPRKDKPADNEVKDAVEPAAPSVAPQEPQPAPPSDVTVSVDAQGVVVVTRT